MRIFVEERRLVLCGDESSTKTAVLYGSRLNYSVIRFEDSSALGQISLLAALYEGRDSVLIKAWTITTQSSWVQD